MDFEDYTDDGYFTCAVSVQHKKLDTEAQVTHESEYDSRKVVWPAQASNKQSKLERVNANTSNAVKHSAALNEHQQQHLEQAASKPWLQNSGERSSRSRNRSKAIMERARSFERPAEEVQHPQHHRNRSKHRSPSANKSYTDESWTNQLERPASRTDVDSRRFDEIGRVQTTDWEHRIKGSMESIPARTPPVRRRENNLKRNIDVERNTSNGTPEPPPPPSKDCFQQMETDFPPPPMSVESYKLSEESVGQISEENKENIVKQWVESTTKSAEEIAKELEKFAYDIAETVVTNMERSSDKKVQKSPSGHSYFPPTTAHTTRHELHGPIYVQEDIHSTKMSSKEERKIEEKVVIEQKMKTEENKVTQHEKQVLPVANKKVLNEHKESIKVDKVEKLNEVNNAKAKEEESYQHHISTGQVKEKRNFWMRSTSSDRNHPMTSVSPAPRRRRIDWNANRQRDFDDADSRPGSSLGQANTGSVRNLSSGFLSKSKSSAAIADRRNDNDSNSSRLRNKASLQKVWTSAQDVNKANNEHFKEVKTNKVNETIKSWGKKDGPPEATSGRATPIPSRNIGEVFQENKISKSKTENNAAASSWRTKTPEPSLTLVNVSVEKGNNATNIAIQTSEKAVKHTSSSYMQVESCSVTSDQSSSMSTTCPPPAPARNQSYGGKCPNTLPVTENDKLSEATNEKVARDVSSPPSTSNIEQSVVTLPSNRLMSNVLQQHNILQNSNSTQSINSVLSTCSSSAIPLPIKAAWFDETESNTSVISVNNNLESNAVTSDYDKKVDSSYELTIPDLDDMLDELITAEINIDGPVNEVKNDPKDIKNVIYPEKSATTDIFPAPETSSVLVVPQSPKDIRRKFEAANSFDKKITKSSDMELSEEFKDGVRGKVKESKSNFMRQVAAQHFQTVDSESKKEEPTHLKFRTAQEFFRTDENKVAVESLRQEKTQELEALKRARSMPRNDEEDEDHRFNAYSQEKKERLLELEQLQSKKNIQNTTGVFLTEVEQKPEICANESADVMEISQQIWNERAEELRQISNLRPKSPWKENKLEKDAPKEIPTRRIGNLFKRNPDYWNLSGDDCMDSNDESMAIMSSTPPTPLRQSSKHKMEEYAQDFQINDSWRKC